MKRSYDQHLNVFWQYNGNPHLEDNITRALINTLSLTNDNLRLEIINFFLESLGEEKIVNDVQITFDLQNPYIKNIKDLNCKKLLIGLNPSGKEWGSEIEQSLKKINLEKDINNELIENDKLLKKFLISKNMYETVSEERLNDYRRVFKTILKRGDSRPDGWIFIFKEGNINPNIVIALESKLFNLDPYQIKNHLVESLGIDGDEKKVNKNITFETLCDKFKNSTYRNPCRIEEHFLDYMEMLGYYLKINSFNENDVLFAIENNYNYIIKNKWNKLFDNFFISTEYNDLSEKIETKINFDLKKRQLWFEKIKNANIYFDTPLEKEDFINGNAIFIGTEIGVNSKDYILYIQKTFKENNSIEVLSSLYEVNDKVYESIFYIFKRINQINFSKYFSLLKSNNLDEILIEFINNTAYENKLSKSKCLELLRKINNEYPESQIDWLIDKINDSSRNNYNLLSYLRFVDYIKYDQLYDIDEKEFNKLFSKMIFKHYQGLKYINSL